MKIFHSWVVVNDSGYEGDVERHFFIVRAHSEELAKKKLRKNEQYLSALNRAEREARRRGYDVEENHRILRGLLSKNPM